MKKDKQAWTGTVPFFVFIVSMIFILWFFFFGLSFWIVCDFLPLWISILSSVYFAFGLYALFLNIPIPRRRKNPVGDLDRTNKIAEGAWCSVYQKPAEPSKVIKQLFFCGWGHNDYRKHRALVLGKEKICGRWNPFVLWFLHYFMIYYQLLGLKRRLAFEYRVEALPTTYNVSYFGLRYEQEYVPQPLTVKNCPSDIEEQFKKLNSELAQAGLYIDDVHAGNVRLTDSGRIRIIDGELYSEGEESMKSKSVIFFNGETVSNMQPVLGNERIVAWVDHRMSVNDIVSASKEH
tara:strand:+ start:2674 stop:3546 length:873 start_codon:yes stop_codon:yes gene_type:complete